MIISAIVVTYFPDKLLLNRLLRSICGEASMVYVIDNTPKESVDWLCSKWFVKSDFEVKYCSLGDNFGIAKAQNVGINFAINDGCDHVILFDQDSSPPIGMIDRLYEAEIKLLNSGIKVGSVGPLFFDEKTNQYSPAIRKSWLMTKRVNISQDENFPVSSDNLIASGSLIRLSVLKEVGLMREDLFIDWVDIEWSLRAGNYGYLHFMMPGVVMLHSIGDEFTSIGNRQINLHSDIRNYYIVRNACHLLLDKSINRQWRTSILLKIPKFVIFYSIKTLSKNKTKAFILLMRACFNGFAGRLGKAF